MEDYAELFKDLTNMTRPTDMEESFIFQKSPSVLRIHKPLPASAEALLKDSKKIYFLKRVPKKANTSKPSFWNVDMAATAPGYFDEAGNFIMDSSDKVSTMWYVKQNDAVRGPLTEGEVKKELESGALRGAQIKRTFDRGYVGVDALVAEIPAFYQSRSLNKYFVANQVVEEKAEATDNFYSDVVVKNQPSKLRNFLRAKSVTASTDFLVKTIKNMRKEDAIVALRGITGLDKADNTILVELLVEDANSQILSDVDKDGFTINQSGRNKRFSRR